MNLKTAFTAGFLTLDNEMSIPPQIVFAFEHYGWGILAVLAAVWVFKKDTVKQASAEGIDRPSYPPE